MAIIAACLVFIGLPAMFVTRAILKFPLEAFTIGGHWQSLWYAVWEQLTGFTIVTALLCIGKKRWNGPSVFLSVLSRSSFAVYIFPPLGADRFVGSFKRLGHRARPKIVGGCTFGGSRQLSAGISVGEGAWNKQGNLAEQSAQINFKSIN